MGKKIDKTGRSKGESRHVRIYHWVMNTPAWKALKAVDRAVYVEIASRYNSTNNGAIGYSVREAAQALQITKSPAAAAFQNLEDTGFIVCTTKGGFSVNNRRATEWRLTEFECNVTDQLASKEFARWNGNFRYRKPRDRKAEASKREAKKQNVVLPAGPIVPPAGQYGAASRTMDLENGSDGAASRTINAELPHFPVPPAGHIYSTRGDGLEEASELASKQGSSSLPLQPDSPKAKPRSLDHLLQTPLMKRSASMGQRKPT